MSKNININLKNLKPLAKKYWLGASRHIVFASVILVLLAYVFMVWKISQLTTAEPTPEQQNTAIAATNIPKVNKKAIEQIQSLEQTNTDIHSLFDQARNNPFQE